MTGEPGVVLCVNWFFVPFVIGVGYDDAIAIPDLSMNSCNRLEQPCNDRAVNNDSR